jgi:hypothetical protein
MTCSVQNCGGDVLALGYCKSHYERFRRHGDPQGGRVGPGSVMAFLEKVVTAETDDCIPWPYAKTGAGYGKININGVLRGVPSEVLLRSGSPKPSPRHVAAHSPEICHNPACINKRHLRWATPCENMADRVLDGTANRGSRHGNAVLTEKDIPTIRADVRPATEIAADLGVNEATVRDVRSGRTWGHIK